MKVVDAAKISKWGNAKQKKIDESVANVDAAFASMVKETIAAIRQALHRASGRSASVRTPKEAI